MFKFKNQNLIRIVSFCLLLLFLSGLIPSVRHNYLNVLKYPLVLPGLIGREAGGIIFYHRNFIRYQAQKNEIDTLTQRLNALTETALENARLQGLLSFKEQQPYKTVAVRVVGRCPDSWGSCMILDKGSRSGIKRGMPVITPLGLVGRITEVSAIAAKAILINDPNLNVSAMVQRSRQEGLISGTLGNNLIMRYLPEEADIKLEDLVITSGLNRSYPKGQVIGTVVDIGREFSGLGRYALIRPAVCLSCVEEVLVVSP